jgi:hypothetical protein
LFINSAVGAFEVRMLRVWIMAGSAAMPIASIKLIGKQHTLVLHIPIHSIAILGDELRVGVESVTNLDAVIVEELL